MLFNRIGFAGQQCLIDEKITCIQKSSVCRHQIARTQFHHIARHELGHEDRDLLPAADGAGAQSYLRLQGVHSVLGAHLLNEVHDHAEHYNRHDNDEAGGIPGGGRQSAGEQQDDDQRIAEENEEALPGRAPLRRGSVIRTVNRKASSSLISREAGGAAAKRLGQRGRGLVPKRRGGH